MCTCVSFCAMLITKPSGDIIWTLQDIAGSVHGSPVNVVVACVFQPYLYSHDNWTLPVLYWFWRRVFGVC